MSDKFLLRDQDWRVGGIVYQVFVDRFSRGPTPPKVELYPQPKRLYAWQTLPNRGKKRIDHPHYEHELDFWGGTIQGLISKLNYIQSLGVTTLYLNPIFHAFTNHKYDTIDYMTISPEYGTMADFKSLLDELNKRDIRLVLDGVFNHMSVLSPIFQDALKNPNSTYRQWFIFGSEYPHGYRAWHNLASLPELNLEYQPVRDFIFKKVIPHYLELGISGWRLDTAIELGRYLYDIQDAVHQTKPDGVVIGEVNHYPDYWVRMIDGVMQLPLRDLIIQTCLGFIPGNVFNRQVSAYIADVGIESMLTSWILLENHDTARIKHDLGDLKSYTIAKVLQFTLPGTVNLYQGEEIGLAGGPDPENREPFPWETLQPLNPTYVFHQSLILLRQTHRALRIGDYRMLETARAIAFMRMTDRYQETLIIVANPSNQIIEETLIIPHGLILSHCPWVDLLTSQVILQSWGILLKLTLQPKTVLVLQPQQLPKNGYLPSKYY